MPNTHFVDNGVFSEKCIVSECVFYFVYCYKYCLAGARMRTNFTCVQTQSMGTFYWVRRVTDMSAIVAIVATALAVEPLPPLPSGHIFHQGLLQ